MGRNIEYCIECSGQFLQKIEANENYKFGAVAPTMGAAHSHSEYKTIWGKEQMWLEPFTLCSYLKILTEEIRWEHKDIQKIIIHTNLIKSVV
jgi:hypothetical protein